MKKLLGVTLGLLTAIGGFVDIGNLVTNAATGARYGMSLTWAVVLGVITLMVFAEMAGRVATLSHRPVFDLVRERLGPRMGLVNLIGSVGVTLFTLIAEIGGVALAVELATGVNYLLWVPLCAFAVWIVMWRVRFETMERAFGLAGLMLFVFVVAVVHLHPDWHALAHQATHPVVPSGEGRPTYFFWAVALFGAAVSPYEVFFFSSGAVEERWTESDLSLNRANVYIGFPVGGLLSLAITAAAALVLLPRAINVQHLSQVGLPVGVAAGRVGLAFVLVGFVAATFGAALETGLSVGYCVAQYWGWKWGKLVRPREAPLFHLVLLVTVAVGAAVTLTTIDPVKITVVSMAFAAVSLPLSYLPILVVANDPMYVGERRTGPIANTVATLMLVVVLVAAVAAIPLLLATKAGM